MDKYFLLFIFLYFFNSFASANYVYRSFVHCLTYNKIPAKEISKIVYSPNSPSFTNILQSYIRNRRFNASTTPKPSAIITPTAEAHVSAAVICAKKLGIQLKIRSGGHDYDGLSYVSHNNFVVLDMNNFRSINISLEDKTAWVESGAQLGELYYRIWEKSNTLAFPAGICPTLGIGGHISGGGYGNMIRKYGLSIDHVVDARIVDAAGQVLDRKAMGEDLFWAIRGGGAASFCVILAFKIELVSVPATVTVFTVDKEADGTAIDAFAQYQGIADKIDSDLFIRIVVQPVTSNNTRRVQVSFIGMFLGDADRLLSITGSQFPKLGLKKSDCQEMRWIDSVLYWYFTKATLPPSVLLNRTPGSVPFLKRKSDYVQAPMPKSGLRKVFRKIAEIGEASLAFNSYGGKMSEISESATPFPHRAGNLFKIQYIVNWQEDGEKADERYINQIRELYDFMGPYVSKNPREAFLNYRDVDIGATNNSKNSYNEGKVYGLKYFKGNFDRLVKIKTMVDPDNVFRNEQSIPVLPHRG